MKHRGKKKKGFKINIQLYRAVMIAMTAIKNIVLILFEMFDKH